MGVESRNPPFVGRVQAGTVPADEEEMTMSQYLLSVHYVEGQGATPPEVMEQAFADVDALNQKMQAEGVWVFAGGLEEPDDATVVREVDGEVVTTDGPFAESKEQLGGFWVLDVVDREAALDWARQATVACRGPVEVRPFQPEPDEE